MIWVAHEATDLIGDGGRDTQFRTKPIEADREEAQEIDGTEGHKVCTGKNPKK
jgi:hypothetical protein